MDELKRNNVSKQSFIYLSIIVTAITIIFVSPANKTDAFTPQVIQQGAIGKDVIELQARLKHIGFYSGEIDGVFGWSTYWALRHFQYEFGMEIDGVAGTQAKEKLVKATEFDRKKVQQEIAGYEKNKPKENQQQNQQNQQSQQNEQTGNQGTNNEQVNEQEAMKQQTGAVNVPQGFSQNDIKLMANAVYGEARGEPYEGQVAVAAVILNRVRSDIFPNTVSGVIFEPRAFTAVADGQIWLTPNKRAEEAVLDAVNGWDPTGHALYYFNPDTATSGWIWTRPQIKKIGKHIFAK